jgi:predicted nucleic acid-binding protein
VPLPATRGVVDVGELARLDLDRVLVDTNVAIDAVVRSQTRHAPARACLEHLTQAGTTIVFNRLLELEMPQAIRYIAERDATRTRGAAARDGRLRRRARTMHTTATGDWAGYLDTVEWIRTEVEEVVPMIEPVMYSTGLSSYDSVMASTAIMHRCTAIVTFDASFGGVHEVDMPLLVTAPSKVVAMRSLRRTARRI